MLISGNKLRKLIKETLLREISMEKWKGIAGDEYRKIYNDRKDTRKEGEYFKDKLKNFEYNPQSGLKPTYLRDLKKWWMKNADQDFFNNQKDLNSKKEEVVVIHDLSAYEGNQGNLILSKFYEEREKYYKSPESFHKNELSALGFTNLDNKDAYEICKEKIGKSGTTGKLNVFLYLNSRKITAAGGGSGDLGTEVFKSYPKKSDDKKEEYSKKQEFIKKIKNFKSAKQQGLDNKEIFDQFGISSMQANNFEKFIIKPVFHDMIESIFEGGNIKGIEYSGIFEKAINKNNINNEINSILEKYKNDILDESLKNNLICNENIVNNLKRFDIVSNDDIFIRIEALIVFFIILLFSNLSYMINLNYIFTSKDKEINDALAKENLNVNIHMINKLCEQDKKIEEYLKGMWLSTLKYFLIKNQKSLNINNNEINKTLEKEKQKDFDDRKSEFTRGSCIFRLESFSINKKEVMKYLNSSDVKDGVEKSYEEATKQSGTRKYPAMWQYDMGNIDKDSNNQQILNSNILDKDEVKNRGYIDEVIVGNWKIDSVWFNLDIKNSDNLKNNKEFISYINNIDDYDKKFMLYNLYYFLSKGFKCFDRNGNELKFQ